MHLEFESKKELIDLSWMVAQNWITVFLNIENRSVCPRARKIFQQVTEAGPRKSMNYEKAA